MIILEMGLPGAGKGSIAKKLQQFFGFEILSTGKLIRQEIFNQTELGLKMKPIVDRGEFVDDKTVIELVKSHFVGGKDVIIEGFPRNEMQAKAFDEMLEKSKYQIDLVLHFDFNEDDMYKRLQERMICPECQAVYHLTAFPPKDGENCDQCNVKLIHREDDSREVLERKLYKYRTYIKPIIEHYKDQGLVYEVDSTQSSMDMYYDVLQSHKKFMARTF